MGKVADLPKSDLAEHLFGLLTDMNAARAAELRPRATRFAKQSAIEEAIDSFRPDPNEAVEILDALMAALNKRYPDQLSDVEDCAKDLRDALVEADGIAG